MLLSEVVETINAIKIYKYNKDKKFNNISTSSQSVNSSSILVINTKNNFKKKYLKEAITKKIPAIISDEYFKNYEVTQFIVKNVERETDKLLNKILPNKPSISLAITGTNGKTSVAWYLSQICKINNLSTKMVGTLGYYKNHNKINDSILTTPSNEDLYKFAYEKRKNNYNFIFESSSHALTQDRLRSINVDIAAITNITQDHLDYHGNLSNYRKAKLLLFTKYLKENGIAVINSRLKNFCNLKKILRKKKIKTIVYGPKNIYFKNANKLYLKIFKKEYLIKGRLLNEIEKQNLECVVACAIAMNIKLKLLLNQLHKLKSPPGRLQEISFKKRNAYVIVDYAHTPDALKKVLLSYTYKKTLPSILFGCGGEREVEKRKIMGLIANKYASKVYITDDNPRNENPKKIRKSILKYCKKAIEIEGRKKAIEIAIKNMKKNDLLIIAGKGHEKYQLMKSKRKKFDDVKIAKNIIKNIYDN